MTVAISAGQFPRSLLRTGVTSYPVITVCLSSGLCLGFVTAWGVSRQKSAEPDGQNVFLAGAFSRDGGE